MHGVPVANTWIRSDFTKNYGIHARRLECRGVSSPSRFENGAEVALLPEKDTVF
jgi:hypothetical protein